MNKYVLGAIATIVSGFTLAIMIAECRQIRQTHDAVIEMKAQRK